MAKRRILFTKPGSIHKDGIHQYRSLVNGVWVYGTYADVMKQYTDGKKSYLKQKANQK